MTNERKIENEIFRYSDYKGKWNAFDEMKVRLCNVGTWSSWLQTEREGNGKIATVQTENITKNSASNLLQQVFSCI